MRYLQRCQGLLQWGEPASGDGDFRAGGDGAKAVRAVHRQGAAGDVYFVANLERASRTVNATFAVAGPAARVVGPGHGCHARAEGFHLRGRPYDGAALARRRAERVRGLSSSGRRRAGPASRKLSGDQGGGRTQTVMVRDV